MYHKKTRSEDGHSNGTSSQAFTDEDRGVFKSFKDSDDTHENRQIKLASNVVTNYTDNLAGTTQGVKKIYVDSRIEEIKEVDEHNDSYDARKQFEGLDMDSASPQIEIEHRFASEGDTKFNDKVFDNKLQETDLEDFKNQETQEGNSSDGDANCLFVEQKFCTVCNIEQPLRSKHCRS
jgi:hypothetical protein